MHNAEHDKGAVARTILEQIGGREFLMVTGSKKLAYDENSLRMRLIRNKSKANFLKITLGSDDLYEMLFTYYRAPSYQIKAGKVLERPEIRKEIVRYEGVYGDMLRSIFSQVTGLETYFPNVLFEKQ